MKYFLDIEFIEGTQRLRKSFIEALFATKIYTEPTIDIISIGITCEDGRQYYAISKDFNLKEAWNRYDLKLEKPEDSRQRRFKNYWIRENVLKPIWEELMIKDYVSFCGEKMTIDELNSVKMTYRHFKKLIKKYGKSNKLIAEEVRQFCLPTHGFVRDWYEDKYGKLDISLEYSKLKEYEENFDKEYQSYQNPEFYGYYSDYDWVVFCWLFGKMIDLPKGFPMFAFDIQQQIEEYKIDKEQLLKEVPQTNCHNSLSNALWNKNAYNWIQNENEQMECFHYSNLQPLEASENLKKYNNFNMEENKNE